MKFTKKMSYYPADVLPVYEFNLPAGHSCPYADVCKVCVDRQTGKMNRKGNGYRCYASASERFPAVRESRWKNFEEVKETRHIELPKGATHVRIHGSGDYFALWYFDLWLETARKHPDILFWSFTKSLPYWVSRLGKIPDNFILTASYGSLHDDLIEEYGLRSVEVFDHLDDVPEGMEIDTDDSLAMKHGDSFALLNNFKKHDLKQEGERQ